MRLVFMGTPEAAVPTLRRCVADGHQVVAVWTQPDRPSGRGHKLGSSPVKQFALDHAIEVFQPSRIKTDEAKSLFASHAAEVAVVVAYGRILPPEFLAAPQRGCINVHFSLLPLYRGAAPVNWAIINGEPETGVTTMLIEPELDSGPILLRRGTTIGATETAPELMSRLSEIGADLLGETLSQLDQLEAQPQNHAVATLAPVLKKEDGLIDWTTDAFAIERRVRGLQPWPNAHTSFRDRQLIIRKAIAENAADGDAVPGEIVIARGDNLVLRCGKSTELRLLDVQPEGKRRLGARDILNGLRAQPGERMR